MANIVFDYIVVKDPLLIANYDCPINLFSNFDYARFRLQITNCTLLTDQWNQTQNGNEHEQSNVELFHF